MLCQRDSVTPQAKSNSPHQRLVKVIIPEKQKAKAAVKAAEREAAELGKSAGALREYKEELEAEVEALKGLSSEKQDRIKDLDRDIKEREAVVRKLDGDVSKKLAECAKV